MVKKYGYIIVGKDGMDLTQRKYKSRVIAQRKIKGIIKVNSITQRRMTGFVGMRIKRVGLYPREIKSMKQAHNKV